MEDNDRIKREQKTDREELLSNCKHASPDSGLEAPFIGKRKRRVTSNLIVCPVCGLSLRSGEVEEHYKKELSSVDDLSDPTSKSSMRMVKRMISSRNKSQSNELVKENESDFDSEQQVDRTIKQIKDFARVKDNRRRRYAKMLLSQNAVSGDILNNPSGYHLLKCPECQNHVEGNEEEFVSHVQHCLKRKEGDLSADEASDDESVDEYTWAGQTRIRVTSMLEPGMYACDGDPIRLQTTNEDEELDIECDEKQVFGESQYSEKDVIPCCSDNPGENEALGLIRAAISSDQAMTLSKENGRCRWNDKKDMIVNDDQNSTDECLPSDGDPSDAIKTLKIRINHLNDELQKEKLKCLICMEGFNTPLVSVICWHVYCEECWLRTLGAKKLCPQCNTITSPADLRKIYI